MTPRSAMKGRAPTAARRAVESVIERATVQAPLTSDEIARRSGIALPLARMHIANLCAHQRAHNTTPGMVPALYAGGPPLAAPDLAHTRARDARAIALELARQRGTYDGRELRPFEGRPGSMQAFSLPSVECGVRHARVAPRLISARG